MKAISRRCSLSLRPRRALASIYAYYLQIVDENAPHSEGAVHAWPGDGEAATRDDARSRDAERAFGASSIYGTRAGGRHDGDAHRRSAELSEYLSWPAGDIELGRRTHRHFAASRPARKRRNQPLSPP